MAESKDPLENLPDFEPFQFQTKGPPSLAKAYRRQEEIRAWLNQMTGYVVGMHKELIKRGALNTEEYARKVVEETSRKMEERMFQLYPDQSQFKAALIHFLSITADEYEAFMVKRGCRLRARSLFQRIGVAFRKWWRFLFPLYGRSG